MKPKRVNEKKAIKVFVNTDLWFCTFVENKVYILKVVLWFVCFFCFFLTSIINHFTVELIISECDICYPETPVLVLLHASTHSPENAIPSVICRRDIWGPHMSPNFN